MKFNTQNLQLIDLHMNDKQKQSFNVLINLKEIRNTDDTMFKVKSKKMNADLLQMRHFGC